MNNSVETKKAEVKKNVKNTLESAKIKIINVISVCHDWEVEYVDLGFNSLNVRLNLKGVEIDRSLEIRYQKKDGNFQEESFNTNVACCGSFDLLDANDNLKYYTAVGDILNHKDMLSLLKDTMVYFTNKLIELREEFDKLRKED